MASHAYIKLVSASTQQEISLSDVRNLLQYYQEITAKTGRQLDWHFGKAAFPYEFAETADGKGKWFYLRATDTENYRYIVFAVNGSSETDEEAAQKKDWIQITLPSDATHGDKGKANEYCKFLAKKLQAELQLFNGRIMYFHNRKS